MIILRQKEYSLISRGLRWIKDFRTTEPLPISLGEYSILLGLMEDNFNKAKEVKKIRAKLNEFYKRDNASRIILRLGLAYARIYYRDISKTRPNPSPAEKAVLDRDATLYSYKRINQSPKRYIIKSLGSGAFGIVFDYRKNKVEKISFSGFSDRELHFYNYLLKNPTKHSDIFPRVYDLESDQVIMEKLDTESPKTKKWEKLLDKYVPFSKKYRSDNGGQLVNWSRIKEELGEDHEFYKWLKKLETGIKDALGGVYKGSVGDLHSGNIGERYDTGEIIYFDPIF